MDYLRRDHRRSSGLVEALSGRLGCVRATGRRRVEQDTDIITVSQCMECGGDNLVLEPEAGEDQDGAVFCGECFDKASVRPWRIMFLEDEPAMG